MAPSELGVNESREDLGPPLDLEQLAERLDRLGHRRIYSIVRQLKTISTRENFPNWTAIKNSKGERWRCISEDPFMFVQVR